MRDLLGHDLGSNGPSAAAVMPDAPVPSSPLAVTESSVGTFFATLLLLMIGVPLTLATVEMLITRSWGDLGARGMVVCVLALAGWLCFDLPYNLKLWGQIRRGRHPAPFAVALEFVEAPSRGPLRVLGAAWWLAHVALALVMVLGMEQLRPSHVDGSDQSPRRILTAYALPFFMAFMFAYAMHGFLLMFMATITRRRGAVEWAWALRLPLDAAIAVTSLIIPKLVKAV